MSKPSRRDRLKPVEYVGFAGAVGIFSGLIVLLVTRDGLLPWIFGGVAFIISLVLIATLTLSMHPERDRIDTSEGVGHSRDESQGPKP